MFGRTELEQLHLRKQQLAAQSEAYRSSLADDWRTLKSPDRWLDEVFGFVQRHPLGTTSLVAGAGVLAFKLLRRPRVFLGGVARLGKLVPLALSVLKIFNRKLKT